MPIDEPLSDRNKPTQVLNAYITRNQRYEDIYFKRFQVFKKNKKKGVRYPKFNAKFKECIQSTVTPQKKATLCTIYPIQQWLIALKYLMVLLVKTFRLNIKLKYIKLMERKHLDWPSGGPNF